MDESALETTESTDAPPAAANGAAGRASANGVNSAGERQRELITRLRELLQDANTRMAAIEAAWSDRSKVIERQLSERRIGAANRLGEETRAAEEAFATAGAELNAAAESAIGAARGSRQKESSIVGEKAETTVARANKELQDAGWFAETCRDTDNAKSKAAREQSKSELASRSGEIEMIQSHASAWLARNRLPAFSTLVGPMDASASQPAAAAAPAADQTTEAAPEVNSAPALVDALARAREELMKLGAVRGARLFAGMAPATIVFVGAVLGAAAAGAINHWKIDTSLAIGAGAGLLLAGAILFWIRGSVLKRAAAAARPLAAVLADARRLHGQASAESADRRARQKQQILDRFQSEVKAAKEKHAGIIGETRRQRDLHLSKLQASCDQTLAEVATRRTERTEQAQRTRDERLAAAEQAHATESQAIDQWHAAAATEARAKHEADWATLRADWVARSGSIAGGLAVIDELATRATAPEADVLDPGHQWPRMAPQVLPVGRYALDLKTFGAGLPIDDRLAWPGPSQLSLPALLELPQRGSLVMNAPHEQRTESIAQLRATMLRLLCTFPPGKVRFTIIDPVGLGESFAGFMHLAEFEDTAGGSLVGERIWTEPRHIEQKLTDITQHMEDVIQKYLRNEFPDIEAYNRQAGEVAEPYRFVVIADFPSGFNESSAKRLASILASGPRCGVYTLLGWDAKLRLPQGLASADLERGALKLVHKNGRFTPETPEFVELPLTLDRPPALSDEAAFTATMNVVGAAARSAAKVEVPFTAVEPPPGQIWCGDSSKELRIPLGKAGATKLQPLVLGKGTAQHALIAGRTGSGKSTLLHVMITNAALWYSPDQVELYLIDFKKGVEFKAYATHGLPHARVIAIESEREFGLSVLRKLDAELKRRGELFRTVGVQDLAGYRNSPNSQAMPRTLLIVDEFQEFFVEDDKLAQEAGLLLDRLVRQGRAFGMHVILGSQTLAGAFSLARSTIGQMAVRIALQCSEADSYLIMSDDNSAPRLLNRPGEAIYNDASGMVEGNNPFQIVWLSDNEREERLDAIHEAVRSTTLRAPLEAPVVFEGSAPALIEQNRLLTAALSNRPATPPIAARAWLGEAVSIKDPSAMVFRRQSASNLLIVGQRDEAAAGLLATAMVSLAAQQPKGDKAARFYLLDGTPADSALAGYLERVAGVMGGQVKIVPYRDVPAIMDELGLELASRQLDGRTDAPSVFLVVNGLHRFRNLRKSEDDFSFGSGDAAATSPDKHLASLLREGPVSGMHTLLWCDTATNLERQLPRAIVREFDGRVLFQMNGGDSSNLIDSPAAANLGATRALFYSEEQGLLEKFRPYALPSDAWLATVRDMLSR